MAGMMDGVLDETLTKYGLPLWIKPYLHEYVKKDPIRAIKYASSFVDVGRKKGTITKSEIKLPNGHKFEREQVLRLLDLFYYGEERISQISQKWASEAADPNWIFAKHFREVAGVEARHARAIRNVIEGLDHKIEEPRKAFVEVFDFVEGLKDWNERLVAKKILFWYSYRASFGLVFYKVFYPVAPEFLRSLSKVFQADRREELLDDKAVEQVIKEKKINDERMSYLVEQLLARVYNSIEVEMGLARKAKVENEARLLQMIAIASPMHVLQRLGSDLDIDKELKEIKKVAQKVSA